MRGLTPFCPLDGDKVSDHAGVVQEIRKVKFD